MTLGRSIGGVQAGGDDQQLFLGELRRLLRVWGGEVGLRLYVCRLRHGLAELGCGFAELPEGVPGLGGANNLVLLLDAGNGVEEELREVADGESILAVNALAGELLDGVGEESVDAVGRVEVAGGIEEFRSESFGIGRRRDVLLKVMGAESVVSGSDGHAAAATGGVDVSALVGAKGSGRHRVFLSKKK